MREHLSWDAINDLVGGELSPADRLAAEAHVASCAECRAAVTSLQDLGRRVADAPESIAPPVDAWLEVRARITGDRLGRPREGATTEAAVTGPIAPGRGHASGRMLTAPWLIAAALVLMAGSSAVTTFVLRRGAARSASVASTAVIRQASLPADIETSERQYIETAAALRATLDEERSNLTPETIAIVERSLTVIEGAIGEAREALVRDPANRELRDLWSRNHQQKLDLLRRAAALVQKS